MEEKRRRCTCFEEENSMEEEWMRDRAQLRDLLEKTPHASPQELAQIIGRSLTWVKKWRQRLAEGDPHDPSVLCSRSRGIMRLTSAGICVSRRRLWRCALLRPRTGSECLGLEPCSTTFLVTRNCKPHRSLSPLQSNDLENP